MSIIDSVKVKNDIGTMYYLLLFFFVLDQGTSY